MRHAMILLMGAFLAACNPMVSETRTAMTEYGTVEQVGYTPDTRKTQVVPVLSMNGNVSFAMAESGERERYTVVFRCQHGKFATQDKAIWEKAVQGQRVEIAYIEIRRKYEQGDDVVLYDLTDIRDAP